jgi:hypothetical protein
MYKHILSTVLLFFAVGTLVAQNFNDAVRYSNLEVGGTARSIGAGGALSALGADFSVLSTNPAGMAWYRRSDFVISPSFYNSTTASTLLNGSNTTNEESRTNFNLNAFGLVAASNTRNPNWHTLNFGIGFNRLANFNNDFYYEGNSQGSLLNRFREQANSGNFSDFESGLAIDAEGLYDLNEDGVYETDFDADPDAMIFRTQDVSRRGAINELVISLASNYREKLMIGATLGVPFVNFREEKTYTEADQGAGQQGDVFFFDELEYTEALNTTGAGINLKLGMIFRATQALRVGLAVHTPTAYSLQDNFETSMTYDYTVEDGSSFRGQATSPDGLFEYNLRTPWRFIGGLGFVYRKLGFFSAEVEYLDYTSNEFRFDGFDDAEQSTNRDVNTQLSNAIKVRLGGEVAYEAFRFRAGLKLLQSPFEGDDTLNNTLSGGVGYRSESFYIDLAYQRNSLDETYRPYLVSDNFPEQAVSNETNNNQIVITLGFRF